MADSSWVIKTKAALRAIKKGEEQMVSFKLLVEKKKKLLVGCRLWHPTESDMTEVT